MEVILFDNVKGLGRQGDLVKVSEGYFRNFLQPKNLAAEATPSALKQYEKMKKKAVELAAAKVAEAKELAEKLGAASVTVKAKAGTGEKLFGAVTNQEIAKALEISGFAVDKKQIETAEPIKTLGNHAVSVRIHPEVAGRFTLKVVRQD
jgi:large subunit ribosomal protein L9